VKALTGRWQKGKDVLWWTREKKDGASGGVNGAGGGAVIDEIAAIKVKRTYCTPTQQPRHFQPAKTNTKCPPLLNAAEVFSSLYKILGEQHLDSRPSSACLLTLPQYSVADPPGFAAVKIGLCTAQHKATKDHPQISLV